MFYNLAYRYCLLSPLVLFQSFIHSHRATTYWAILEPEAKGKRMPFSKYPLLLWTKWKKLMEVQQLKNVTAHKVLCGPMSSLHKSAQWGRVGWLNSDTYRVEDQTNSKNRSLFTLLIFCSWWTFFAISFYFKDNTLTVFFILVVGFFGAEAGGERTQLWSCWRSAFGAPASGSLSARGVLSLALELLCHVKTPGWAHATRQTVGLVLGHTSFFFSAWVFLTFLIAPQYI